MEGCTDLQVLLSEGVESIAELGTELSDALDDLKVDERTNEGSQLSSSYVRSSTFDDANLSRVVVRLSSVDSSDLEHSLVDVLEGIDASFEVLVLCSWGGRIQER